MAIYYPKNSLRLLDLGIKHRIMFTLDLPPTATGSTASYAQEQRWEAPTAVRFLNLGSTYSLNAYSYIPRYDLEEAARKIDKLIIVVEKRIAAARAAGIAFDMPEQLLTTFLKVLEAAAFNSVYAHISFDILPEGDVELTFLSADKQHIDYCVFLHDEEAAMPTLAFSRYRNGIAQLKLIGTLSEIIEQIVAKR